MAGTAGTLPHDPSAILGQLETETASQLCLRLMISGPPYADREEAKSALKDAALAARDYMNISCEHVILHYVPTYIFGSSIQIGRRIRYINREGMEPKVGRDSHPHSE
jgi:hypothetical protein